jgi:hypothetical protein
MKTTIKSKYCITMSNSDLGCIKHRCIHLYGTDCTAVTADTVKFETATITNVTATNINGVAASSYLTTGSGGSSGGSSSSTGTVQAKNLVAQNNICGGTVFSDVLKSWAYHDAGTQGLTLPLQLDSVGNSLIDYYEAEFAVANSGNDVGSVGSWGGMIDLHVGLQSFSGGVDGDVCPLHIIVGQGYGVVYEQMLPISVQPGAAVYFNKKFFCGPGCNFSAYIHGPASNAVKVISFNSFTQFTYGNNSYSSFSQADYDANKTHLQLISYDNSLNI